MEKKVAIVIVNWNGQRLLKDCFNAIEKQSYKNYDIYFVDNGSSDNSVEYIKNNFPKTNIILLDKNYGFAIANNRGIERVLKDKSVEYIVCLNNDTIVDPDWLMNLVKYVDPSKKIHLVSSKAYFTDGNIQTIGLRFEKNLIGNKIGGLSIGYGEKPDNYNQAMEIFCPTGVAFLMTRTLINDIGLFDEDFFCYGEDFDLGIRAQNKGYKCMFSPDAKLIHLHSQTSGGVASPMKAYLSKRNNYFIVIKNFKFTDLISYPFRDFFWNFKSLLEKNENKSVNKLKGKIGIWGMVKLVSKAYFMVLVYAPKMFYKRFKTKKY